MREKPWPSFPRASASAKCAMEHVHRLAGEPEGLEARACLVGGHGGSPYRAPFYAALT